MADDLGERTEMPTGRRLSEARQRGQIPKSQDLGAVIDLVGGMILLSILGTGVFAGMKALMRALLDSRMAGGGDATEGVAQSFSIDWLGSTLLLTGKEMAMLILPFLAVMFLIAAASQFVQVGILFTLEPLRPKFNKLNPISGVSRLFSKRSLIKSLMGAAKMGVLMLVAGLMIRSWVGQLAALPVLGAAAACWVIAGLIAELMTVLLAILLVIALGDFWYQKWQHLQDLKMTKQQVQDEMRSMEGDPEVKGRRLKMAREMIVQRIRQSVPTADVVVSNPTHFSVALKYDPETMAAPVVVAKGADYLALRIREIAAANGVPLIERPPLARALYHHVPVGKEISAEYFEAVAELLAYVYRLKQEAA